MDRDAGPLADALSDVQCGTTVALAAGSYSGEVAIHAECTADQPLVIKSAQSGQAHLTGKLRLLGQHIAITGLTVQGGEIEVRGSDNRVTRNLFVTPGGLAVRATTSSRIDHNEFATPGGRGVDFAFKFSKNDKRPARDIRVDHNLFRSASKESGASDDDEDEDVEHGSVGIYLGQFSARRGRQNMLDYGSVGVIVEDNLFLNYKRRKAIHVKSIGNIIRNNNFIDENHLEKWARVTIRSGQENQISNNLMDGTTGLQIFEENNSATGNVLTGGSTLVVMGGGGEMTQYGGPQQRQAVGTHLVGNSGPLTIGATYAKRANKTPATDTLVEDHDGPIEQLLDSGTVIQGSASRKVQLPQRLQPTEVGLSAADADCPSGDY